MNKRFDTLFNLISKNNMVLERKAQQTNRNINETYLNNIKENKQWKQKIVKDYTIKSTARKS